MDVSAWQAAEALAYRVRRGREAISAGAQDTGDAAETLTDALANMMHAASADGIDFLACLRRAQVHYGEEGGSPLDADLAAAQVIADAVNAGAAMSDALDAAGVGEDDYAIEDPGFGGPDDPHNAVIDFCNGVLIERVWLDDKRGMQWAARRYRVEG
jgi:hypothetical protein